MSSIVTEEARNIFFRLLHKTIMVLDVRNMRLDINVLVYKLPLNFYPTLCFSNLSLFVFFLSYLFLFIPVRVCPSVFLYLFLNLYLLLCLLFYISHFPILSVSLSLSPLLYTLYVCVSFSR